MGRIRELLAQGGIALLAVVFALAFTVFELANQIAFAVMGVIEQHAIDENGNGLTFSIAGTKISYAGVLQALIGVVVVAAALYAVWRLARRASRQCPECLSDVPARASTCRYCTSELPSQA